ncbi:cupin [candidate division TA06 bacterium B3_TA06]|uniref:Cupin n=1 Tax=candidate division TA06 bacterium B3_TA06 TaxID=2012487 RepID=A0A532V1D4_UNCT6|nr:MAG: cupin [candidate division TA06 bacterium B3_TA06]
MESQNKDLRPQVFDLAGMLSYQDGAVVSHTIIDKKQGTVTLFAFDKDQGLSEHTAPSDAMVYILDGQAEITISGKPYTLSAGEMILMPASQPHALRALTRFKMLLVMVKS